MARKKGNAKPAEAGTPGEKKVMEEASPTRLRRIKEVLDISNSVIAQAGAVGSFILAAVVLYLKIFGNSYTSVDFLSADAKVIQVRVWNKGLRASIVRTYRLKFPDLPIEDTTLELTEADGGKALVSGDNVDLGKRQFDFGFSDIHLIVPGLVPKPEPGLNEQVLLSRLGQGHATLEIDVREAKDPRGASAHVYTDTFPAESIYWIIKDKILFESEAR